MLKRLIASLPPLFLREAHCSCRKMLCSYCIEMLDILMLMAVVIGPVALVTLLEVELTCFSLT